jgi:hypothetical protein
MIDRTESLLEDTGCFPPENAGCSTTKAVCVDAVANRATEEARRLHMGAGCSTTGAGCSAAPASCRPEPSADRERLLPSRPFLPI